METKIKVKNGLRGFGDFISFLRRAGHEILATKQDNGYQILTIVRNKGNDDNWINTIVIQEMN